MIKLKLGVVNIMPHARQYDLQLRTALADVADLIELYPIRLVSHAYLSSATDVAQYHTFSELNRQVSLDLLLVTGAPVEHLPFDEIRYMPELEQIFGATRGFGIPVCGLCFGALAIAGYLGIGKRVQQSKVFGVYKLAIHAGVERHVGALPRHLYMPFSTWALLDPDALALANRHGGLVTLASHPDLGPVMLASHDHQFLMLLGHPEYSVATLRQEWLRDSAKQIPYTSNFSDASFDEMARTLQSGASPALSNWVIEHFNRATLAA
ncbi:homoserine O-succinyltransferase [Janthinobacterium lividum]|nr:homoserine O-succinyltransferase [Janthinobacterium lividum]